MRYVVGLMMAAFFLAGVGLFGAGVRELVRRLAARRRLRRAEGEIVRIEVRQKTTDSDSLRTADYHYPEIRFRSESEGAKTFISEIGAGALAERYAVGQKIAVLYDPDGEIRPMIDSWAGFWMPHLIHAIVGPMLILVALFLYWAFGERILEQ